MCGVYIANEYEVCGITPTQKLNKRQCVVNI